MRKWHGLHSFLSAHLKDVFENVPCHFLYSLLDQSLWYQYTWHCLHIVAETQQLEVSNHLILRRELPSLVTLEYRKAPCHAPWSHLQSLHTPSVPPSPLNGYKYFDQACNLLSQITCCTIRSRVDPCIPESSNHMTCQASLNFVVEICHQQLSCPYYWLVNYPPNCWLLLYGTAHPAIANRSPLFTRQCH